MWRVDRQSARWHCDRGGCRRGQQRRARGGSVIGSEVRTRFGVYTPYPRVVVVDNTGIGVLKSIDLYGIPDLYGKTPRPPVDEDGFETVAPRRRRRGSTGRE